MIYSDAYRELYAGLGFAVVPLHPRAKRPLRSGWQRAPAEAWGNAPVDANVGIVCGDISGGLVVLDFDIPDGPREVLGMKPSQLALLTIVVQTARGWHVYARSPGLGTSSPRPGLDVRGDGSLVVAPPSVHPSGVRYAFVGNRREVAGLDVFAPDLAMPGNSKLTPGGACPDLAEVEPWIALQAPKLREAWRALQGEPPDSFDRSRADFAVARCLWEAGYSVEQVAAVLLSLPGSKARERGESYAHLTAARAARLGHRRPREGPFA